MGRLRPRLRHQQRPVDPELVSSDTGKEAMPGTTGGRNQRSYRANWSAERAETFVAVDLGHSHSRAGVLICTAPRRLSSRGQLRQAG